jgi:hypothetical protein
MTGLSGLRTCLLPWSPFESLDPNLISMEKILPMGISRLSRKFLVVLPNSNVLALLIMMNLTAASGLVGSGSFVTKLNSMKRGPMAQCDLFLTLRQNINLFVIYVLEVFSFLSQGTSICLCYFLNIVNNITCICYTDKTSHRF